MMTTDLTQIKRSIQSDTQAHQDEIEQHEKKIRAAYSQVKPSDLTDWDIESLYQANEILHDERVLNLRRQIAALMKSKSKNFELERTHWVKRSNSRKDHP